MFVLLLAKPLPPREDGTMQKGLQCPFCTAVLRWSNESPLAAAGNVVLANYGVYTESEPELSPVDSLVRDCRSECDVDAAVTAIRDINLERTAGNAGWMLSKQRNVPYALKLLDAVKQARTAIEDGSLVEAIRPAAELAKQRIRAERERCLRVFEARAKTQREP